MHHFQLLNSLFLFQVFLEVTIVFPSSLQAIMLIPTMTLINPSHYQHYCRIFQIIFYSSFSNYFNLHISLYNICAVFIVCTILFQKKMLMILQKKYVSYKHNINMNWRWRYRLSQAHKIKHLTDFLFPKIDWVCTTSAAQHL